MRGRSQGQIYQLTLYTDSRTEAKLLLFSCLCWRRETNDFLCLLNDGPSFFYTYFDLKSGQVETWPTWPVALALYLQANGQRRYNTPNQTCHSDGMRLPITVQKCSQVLESSPAVSSSFTFLLLLQTLSSIAYQLKQLWTTLCIEQHHFHCGTPFQPFCQQTDKNSSFWQLTILLCFHTGLRCGNWANISWNIDRKNTINYASDCCCVCKCLGECTRWLRLDE